MSLRGTLTPGQYLTGRINRATFQIITAYGIAVKNGFKGTEEEWLTYLSAYGIACKNGFVGTEEEWLMSLEANPERIQQYVTEYLESNPVQVDATLTVDGMAADALTTGGAIAEVATATQTAQETADNAMAKAEENADVLSDVMTRKAETEDYIGTFSSSGWSSSAPYTQTITVNGVLSTDYPFVDIDLSNVSDTTAVIKAWKMVGRCTVSADNTVIAYCYEEKPTVNIPIIFKVVR